MKAITQAQPTLSNEKTHPVMAMPASQVTAACVKIPVHLTLGVPLLGAAVAATAITGFAMSIFSILMAGAFGGEKQNEFTKYLTGKFEKGAKYSFDATKGILVFEWQLFKDATEQAFGVDYDDNKNGGYLAIIKESKNVGELKEKTENKLDDISADNAFSTLEQQGRNFT